MTDTDHKLLVVIVNYRNCDDVVRAVASLVRHIRVPMQIVIVDNSPEPECDAISSMPDNVFVISAGENLGFAGGCNLGVRTAEDNWSHVLFFNPDAYCENDFVTPIIEAMEKDKSWGILIPRIYANVERTETWFAGSTLSWWRGGSRHVYDERFSHLDSPVEIPFASGGCSLVNRETWDQVGEMEDSYFLYFEDNDYVERVKHAGKRIGYLPKLHVIHEASKSTGFQSPLYLYYFARNRVLFARRWAPWPQRWLFYLFLWGVKVPGSWIVFALIRKTPRRASAFTIGTLDGFKEKVGPALGWHF